MSAIAVLPRRTLTEAEGVVLIHRIALHLLVGLADTVASLDAGLKHNKPIIRRIEHARPDLWEDLNEAYWQKEAELRRRQEARG